jgi:hypothetical protein
VTKRQILAGYIRRRLKNLNKPQIFGLPMIHKDLGVKRQPGGGSFIDCYFGNIRRAGMLRQVGTIRSGAYYVFTSRALRLLRGDPTLLVRWIARGKHWQA